MVMLYFKFLSKFFCQSLIIYWRKDKFKNKKLNRVKYIKIILKKVKPIEKTRNMLTINFIIKLRSWFFTVYKINSNQWFEITKIMHYKLKWTWHNWLKWNRTGIRQIIRNMFQTWYFNIYHFFIIFNIIFPLSSILTI